VRTFFARDVLQNPKIKGIAIDKLAYLIRMGYTEISVSCDKRREIPMLELKIPSDEYDTVYMQLYFEKDKKPGSTRCFLDKDRHRIDYTKIAGDELLKETIEEISRLVEEIAEVKEDGNL
ncbi:hypothetical protein, partial [Ruminococcus sp.]|uniref:hypothetical protein n=1 Tax=Ruminococcus sp. TaxID=41978 RepID=UPI00258F2C35